MKKSLLGAMLLSLATAATAQMTYKYQRPDGSIVYSDKPVPGARLVDEIPPEPAAPVQRSTPLPATQPRNAGMQPSARSAALDAADAEIKAAQKAVDEAKDRLEKGTEPLAGERIANANGTNRLSDDYLARMQRLEQDLKDATARLDRAYQRRNEAR